MRSYGFSFLFFLTFYFQCFSQLKLELPTYIPTGNQPVYHELQDINRDNIPDLVLLNEGDNSLSVKLGNADGSFGEPKNYAVSASPRQFVLFDFNGDSLIDVASTGFDQDLITILFGNTAGEFSNRMDIASGSRPYGIVAGEVNNDEFQDLIVTFSGTDSIGVYVGEAEGSFQSRESFFSGPGPSYISLNHMNGDNFPDIIVANDGASKITILSGDGSGKFSLASEISNIDVSTFCIEDFDNDDINDILVADRAPSALIFFKGNGDMSFSEVTRYSSENISGIKELDFDNDDDFDFCFIENKGYLVVYENDEGLFSKKLILATGENPRSIEIKDYNGDSLVDISVSNYDDNSVVIFNNITGESFSGIEVLPYETAGPVIKVDLNGDGKPDIAYPKASGAIGVVYGYDEGFSDEFTFSVDSGPVQVIATDANNDSIPDLVSVNLLSNSISILLNNGDNTFKNRINYSTGLSPGAAVAGDFNSDGLNDIIVANTSDNTISVFVNQGNGSFLIDENIDVILPDELIVDDLNNDERLDLIVGRDTYEPVVLYGASSNFFEETDSIFCKEILGSIQLLDVDQDLDQDLLVFVNGGITVISGSESGITDECKNTRYLGVFEFSGQIDVNNDGNMDIVTF